MDIIVPVRLEGRPVLLRQDEEQLIAAAARDFTNRNTPLTLTNFLQLASHVCKMLPLPRRREFPFVHRLPSIRWVKRLFIRHPEVSVRSV